MFFRCLASGLLLILSVSFSVRSQEHPALPLLEDSLSSLQHRIQKAENDSLRISLNFLFRETLRNAIGQPGSFTYPFDSLKKTGKLTSPDGAFRIYNWNLPSTSGTNRYFCFLQVLRRSSKNSYSILELSDRSDSIPDPQYAGLDARSWYGALYYKIIPARVDGGMIYTLLGWEGRSFTQNRKVIEILTFDEGSFPHFGKKIFNKYEEGNNKRVIFTYSSSAVMLLRYDEQSVSRDKKPKSAPGTSERKMTKSAMIICDRLINVESKESKIPDPVPSGEIFDGFLFENGRWSFVEGVDARNK
jgi:hypothetical protein